MSNIFHNRISLIGNRAVEMLNSEINYRFIDDSKLNGFSNSLAIYRIFYGLNTRGAKRLQKADKVGDAYYIDDTQYMATSTGFTMISEPVALDGLQSHILFYAGQFDPHLIVCNQSRNIPVSACTVRFAVVDGGEIKEVVVSKRFQPPKRHNAKSDRCINKIRREIKVEAFELLKRRVAWVTNAMYRPQC